MKNSPIRKAFSYIGKIISSSLIVILILVGAFLVYYLISARKLANDPNYEPPIRLYTIVSGSMEPNIKVYDIVVDLKVNNPAEIKVGDVITFKSTSSISNGLIVTHRVVGIKEVNGQLEYVTKGDYNPTPDSDTAKFNNVIGKVSMRFPQLGRLQFFLASKMGWLLVVVLPALGVIIYDILKLFKLIKIKNTGNNIKGKKDVEEINNTFNNNEYMEKLKILKEFENE